MMQFYYLFIFFFIYSRLLCKMYKIPLVKFKKKKKKKTPLYLTLNNLLSTEIENLKRTYDTTLDIQFKI